MAVLQLLRPDLAASVLAFEVENRSYFAASISDRGDEYFDRYTELYDALLADQEAGHGAFHVLVDEDGSVLGRFNLTFTEPGVAELGYRVAERAAGRGLATATVLELAELAPGRYGVASLRAASSLANVASQRVLSKAGFVLVGPADPADLGGKEGSWYQLDLSTG